MTCAGPECEHEVFRSDLCFGHYRQRRLGKALRTLRARGQSASQRLNEAAIAYADAFELQEVALEFANADSDGAMQRAEARLRMAALAYARRSERSARTA